MPFNGSGTWSNAGTSFSTPVTGTTISSTAAQTFFSDLASNGLSKVITKDGQTTLTANIPFGNNKLTGLGAATARTDAIQYAQVQDGSPTYLTAIAGTNTLTASAANSMSAYATGQRFSFIPANTNTGATTLNINSLGAKNIYLRGVALSGGEVVANVPASVLYDGTQFNLMEYLPNGEFRSVQVYTTSGSNTWTKPAGLKRVIVTVVGGGGAGGGAAATGVGQVAAASGGAAGGASIKVIEASSLGATETATVGAAGTAAAGTAGTSGGTSSFGSHCSATGGEGGNKTAAGAGPLSVRGALGGVGSSGNINFGGGSSLASFGIASGSVIHGSAGGNSYLGGGGNGVTANSGTGIAAQGYGAGGSGTASDQNQSSVAGGAAKDGIITVEEFF